MTNVVPGMGQPIATGVPGVIQDLVTTIDVSVGPYVLISCRPLLVHPSTISSGSLSPPASTMRQMGKGISFGSPIVRSSDGVP